MCMMQLASALDTVNTFVDSRGVLGALLVAAITTGAGLWWRGRRPAREVSWNVEYDEPLNQGQDAPGPNGHDNGAPQNPAENPYFWDIQFRGERVVDGSLVLLRVRSTGTSSIQAKDFESGLSFTFADREVLGFKVRDNAYVHGEVEKARQAAQQASAPQPVTTPDPRTPSQPATRKPLPKKIDLPRFLFNRRSEFTLLILLQGDATSKAVEAEGQIVDGRIVRHDARRPPYRLLAVGTVFAVLIAGVTLGVRLANDALTPTASCSGGHLSLEGSSAFAPVANQVANGYRHICGPGATVTITADGSERGLASLEGSHNPATIAMSDGLPPSVTGTESLVGKPVGVVTFAVVANVGLRATLPDLFGTNGISADELRRLFSSAGDPSTPSIVAVGRTHASGTRAAFAGAYFGGADPEPTNAAACEPSTTRGFCTSDNTMDLLSFVESHPDAIGYAEADALPYFPAVQVIAVDGQLPTEQAVISGAYPFVATEYLYTAGEPAGLAADYLRFLTSPAETAALRGHGFIACNDLAGTKRDGACAG
jgi:ABC-type phosphate transport system substrate-binding protein